jgi:hypothetical protein
MATTATLCNATDGLIDAQRTTRFGKVNAACAAIPFADLQPYVGGLGMISVPGGCTVASSTDLVNCLLDTARCAGEQQVFRPIRAAGLADRAGQRVLPASPVTPGLGLDQPGPQPPPSARG